MSHYGFSVTDKGRALIAKLVAGKQLNLSRIMVGTGICPDDVQPRTLTDLVEPVAQGTSSTPTYNGACVKMIVEYRSDLNGGLDYGFWLREFGVYAYDPDEGEVLIYYGCLGDYPQWVSAMSTTGVDVRRFPVSIVIGEGYGVTVDYNCEIWMTAEDVENYCTITMLPQFLEAAAELIAAHNADSEAHNSIINLLNNLDSRVTLLELIVNTGVDQNQFTVTFATLDGKNVQGVWNTSAQRIEF